MPLQRMPSASTETFYIRVPDGPYSVPPRSVSVAASSCIEAGLLATLALLHGDRARVFLDEEGVRYWVLQ
jgi:hypothetical protein